MSLARSSHPTSSEGSKRLGAHPRPPSFPPLRPSCRCSRRSSSSLQTQPPRSSPLLFYCPTSLSARSSPFLARASMLCLFHTTCGQLGEGRELLEVRASSFWARLGVARNVECDSYAVSQGKGEDMRIDESEAHAKLSLRLSLFVALSISARWRSWARWRRKRLVSDGFSARLPFCLPACRALTKTHGPAPRSQLSGTRSCGQRWESRRGRGGGSRKRGRRFRRWALSRRARARSRSLCHLPAREKRASEVCIMNQRCGRKENHLQQIGPKRPSTARPSSALSQRGGLAIAPARM